MASFTIPHHIITGNNILSEASPIIKTMGRKAFIVTGKHVAKSDMMQKLKDLLSLKTLILKSLTA